ncbi:hypothetical protein [Pseudomonas sp. 25 E 4]|nr:hypothetical protein [Pseudomonas sp. 25 E 4]
MLHAFKQIIGNAPWRADDNLALPCARGGALVEQVTGGDTQVAIGSHQAVAVLHIVALQQHVFASHQARRHRIFGRRLKVRLVDGDQAFFPAVFLTAVLATDPTQAACGQRLTEFELIFGVFDKACIDANRAFAFHGAGAVAEQHGRPAVPCGEAQVAFAVDIAIEVAETIAAQSHVAAAEQQRIGSVGDAVDGSEVQRTLGTEGATVVDLCSGDIQLLARGEEAEVVQGAAQVEPRIDGRQTPAVLAEVIGRHRQVLQGRDAAAVGDVATGGDAQVTVAEQFAAVVQAGYVKHQALAAGQTVARLEGQALGTFVGEHFVELHAAQAVDLAERPVGGAHAVDAAQAAAEAGGVEVEQAQARMLHLAGLVVQAGGVEAESGAAEFEGAVLVVDRAAEVEAAARTAQRAQLAAGAVVEVAAAEGQALVGFDQAATVGQGVA